MDGRFLLEDCKEDIEGGLAYRISYISYKEGFIGEPTRREEHEEACEREAHVIDFFGKAARIFCRELLQMYARRVVD